jgi:hypothetical protein
MEPPRLFRIRNLARLRLVSATFCLMSSRHIPRSLLACVEQRHICSQPCQTSDCPYRSPPFQRAAIQRLLSASYNWPICSGHAAAHADSQLYIVSTILSDPYPAVGAHGTPNLRRRLRLVAGSGILLSQRYVASVAPTIPYTPRDLAFDVRRQSVH